MALDSFKVRKAYQIGCFYTAYKASALVEKEREGKKPSEEDINKLRVLRALLNSIEPYATNYTQPSFTFGVSAAVTGSVVSFLIGDVTIDGITLVTNNTTIAAKQMADRINEMNVGFTAFSEGVNITVKGVSGPTADGLAITPSATNGTAFSLSIPTELSSDGSDYFSANTARCLTDAQIESIMDKINSGIDVPCSKFINF